MVKLWRIIAEGDGFGEKEEVECLKALTLSRALFLPGWSVAPGILGTRRGQEKQV